MFKQWMFNRNKKRLKDARFSFLFDEDSSGEYIVYDNNGSRLQLTIEQIKKRTLFKNYEDIEVIKVTGIDAADCSSDLRNKLINFFKQTKFFCQKDTALPLQTLINKAVELYGYTK